MVTKRELYERPGRRRRPKITEAGAERIGEVRTQRLKGKVKERNIRNAKKIKKKESKKIKSEIQKYKREIKKQKKSIKDDKEDIRRAETEEEEQEEEWELEEEEGELEGMKEALKELKKEYENYKEIDPEEEYEKILANKDYSEKLKRYARDVEDAREEEAEREIEQEKAEEKYKEELGDIESGELSSEEYAEEYADLPEVLQESLTTPGAYEDRREELMEEIDKGVEELKETESPEEYRQKYEKMSEVVKRNVKSPEEIKDLFIEREPIEIDAEPGEAIMAEPTEEGGVKITYGGKKLAEQTAEGEVIDVVSEQEIEAVREAIERTEEPEPTAVGEFEEFEAEDPDAQLPEYVQDFREAIGVEDWTGEDLREGLESIGKGGVALLQTAGIPVKAGARTSQRIGERALEDPGRFTFAGEAPITFPEIVKDIGRSLEGSILEGLKDNVIDLAETIEREKGLSDTERKQMYKRVDEKIKDIKDKLNKGDISLEEANVRANQILDIEKAKAEYGVSSVDKLDEKIREKLDEPLENPRDVAELANANMISKVKEKRQDVVNEAVESLDKDIENKAEEIRKKIKQDKISRTEGMEQLRRYVEDRTQSANQKVKKNIEDYAETVRKKSESQIEEAKKSSRIKGFLLSAPGIVAGAAVTGGAMSLLSRSSKLGAVFAASEDIADLALAAPEFVSGAREGDIGELGIMAGSLGLSLAGGYAGGKIAGDIVTKPRIESAIENARVETEIEGKGLQAYRGLQLPEDVETEIKTLVDRGYEVRRVRKNLRAGTSEDVEYLPDARADAIEVINRQGELVKRFSVGRAVSQTSGKKFTKDILELAAGKLEDGRADFITERIEGRIYGDKFVPLEEVRGLQESELVEQRGEVAELDTERFELGRREFETPASPEEAIKVPRGVDAGEFSERMLENIGRFPTQEKLESTIFGARRMAGEPEARTRTFLAERTTDITAARTQPEVETEDFWFGGPQEFRGAREFETIGRGVSLGDQDFGITPTETEVETEEGMIGGGIFDSEGDAETELQQEQQTISERTLPPSGAGDTSLRGVAEETIEPTITQATRVGAALAAEPQIDTEADIQQRQFAELAQGTQFDFDLESTVETEQDIRQETEQITEPIVETDIMQDIAQDLETMQEVELEQDLEQEPDITTDLETTFEPTTDLFTDLEVIGAPDAGGFEFGEEEEAKEPYEVEVKINGEWVGEGEADSYYQAFSIGANRVLITDSTTFRIRIPGGRAGAKEAPTFEYRDRFKRKVGKIYDTYELKSENKQESTEDYWFG